MSAPESIDNTPWQLAPRPRMSWPEFFAALPPDLQPPVLHLRRMRYPYEDEITGRMWIPVLMPAECWRDWMDPNYRPQLAIEGPRS
jgi:hypothetical protein